MSRDLHDQRFGAHLSVAGGLEKAFAAATELGCDCLQIFVKNQRQWSAPPLSEEQIRRFRAAARGGPRPVLAHGSYLLNLASPDSAVRRRSILALIDELTRCEALGIRGLVLHPGAHLGEGLDRGIARIAASLDEAHDATPGFRVRALLETTAGQGTTIGHEPAHLGRVLGGVRHPERLGVCVDTCHVFAAGYDLRAADGYERLIADLSRHVGLRRIHCLHVNDSQAPCHARVDRHEHIGRGRIGRAGFVRLVNDQRLAALPKILETPKGRDGRGVDLDRVNLRRLRGMIGRPAPAARPSPPGRG